MSVWRHLLDEAGFVPSADLSLRDQPWDDFPLEEAAVLDHLFSAAQHDYDQDHAHEHEHDNDEGTDMARKRTSRKADDDDIADGSRRQTARDQRVPAETDPPDAALHDVIVSSARQPLAYGLGDTGTHEARSTTVNRDDGNADEDSLNHARANIQADTDSVDLDSTPYVPDLDSDQSGMAVDHD